MEEYLANLVDTAVPDLEFGKSMDVATHLVDTVGITTMDRLKLLREEDFSACLRPAEARLCMLALSSRK